MSSTKKMNDISLKGLVQNTAADAEFRCYLPTYIHTYRTNTHTHIYINMHIYIYIYTHTYVGVGVYIQGVTGGTDQTSGGCSLC